MLIYFLMTTKGYERRLFGRRTTRTYAWVEMAARPRVSCIIMNVSQTGALIELMDYVLLPIQFTLIVEHLPGCEYCEVRHQNQRRAGVRFIDELADGFDRRRAIVTDADTWRG